MASNTVDEILLGSGASIEVDAQNLYFLKIRFYPTDGFLANVTRIPVASYSHSFYHQEDENQRSGDIYFRISSDVKGEDSVNIVRQDCKDLTNSAHCYKEVKLTSLPPDMIKYLSYKFHRERIEGCNFDTDMELYADTVFEPVEYMIVTLRVKLKFDPTVSDSFELLKEELCKLSDYQKYPVYTKFMLVLQCCPEYELYETLYARYDPSRHLVPNKIEQVLTEKSNLLANRDYIWYVSNQIEEARYMHEMDYDINECYDRLKLLRPTGNDYIDSCDDYF